MRNGNLKKKKLQAKILFKFHLNCAFPFYLHEVSHCHAHSSGITKPDGSMFVWSRAKVSTGVNEEQCSKAPNVQRIQIIQRIRLFEKHVSHKSEKHFNF